MVKVEVVQSEFDALEHQTVAWNLCKKHNSIINVGDDKYWKFTQTCRKCAKINKELRHKNLHLWSKLATAYLKAAKKKAGKAK